VNEAIQENFIFLHLGPALVIGCDNASYADMLMKCNFKRISYLISRHHTKLTTSYVVR